MVLEPGFHVRLGVYDINAEVLTLRSEIWALLEPHLAGILHRNMERVAIHIPLYGDIFAKAGEDFKAMNFEYTMKSKRGI
jgi:hypothetical protein